MRTATKMSQVSGRGGRSAQPDLTQPDVFLRRAGQQHAQIGGKVGQVGLLLRDAARAREHDFSGALAIAAACARCANSMACSRFSAEDPGWESANRFFHDSEIRLKRRGGRRQRVGAHQHHPVAAGQRAQIGSRGILRFIEQRAFGPEPRWNPIAQPIQADVSRIRT